LRGGASWEETTTARPCCSLPGNCLAVPPHCPCISRRRRARTALHSRDGGAPALHPGGGRPRRLQAHNRGSGTRMDSRASIVERGGVPVPSPFFLGARSSSCDGRSGTKEGSRRPEERRGGGRQRGGASRILFYFGVFRWVIWGGAVLEKKIKNLGIFAK
jgi:hypothetical protein